jgi:hypothetical protein
MELENMNDLKELQQQAREVRRQFPSRIYFSVPGAKHYDTCYYKNQPRSFVNISVTGRECACRCDHCQGRLLATMEGVLTPRDMRRLVDRLLEQGGRGILVSGGADRNGEVPLFPYIEVIKYAKQMGLKVLVHTGLVRKETAAALKEAGVDQVLLDVIGDETTIRRVYHLDRTPDDYLASLLCCRQEGLKLAPHVVIGLHYGRVLGEVRALEMIRQAEPETLVLVILTPGLGTAMAEVAPPPLEEVARVIARARILHPVTPLTLGCARPAGLYKRQVEITAVDCGVNGIAYPDEATVAYALNQGLEIRFSEECCSLIAGEAGLS